MLHRPRQLRSLAIGVAGVERGDIGLGNVGFLGELVVQPVNDRLPVAVEHPQRETERPHVLAAQRFLVAQPERLHGIERQLRDIEGQQLPLGERAVLERIDVVFRLVEVAFAELAAVGNDQPAGLERLHVGLERCGVHCHQHIGLVARSVDLAAAEVDLERGDAE